MTISQLSFSFFDCLCNMAGNLTLEREHKARESPAEKRVCRTTASALLLLDA